METLKASKDTELKAALAATLAVSETIRELGEVPSGHLYVQLMGMMNFNTYTQMIQVLKNAGLVKEENSHLLKWIGPLKGV